MRAFPRLVVIFLLTFGPLFGCRTKPTEPAKVEVEGKLVFEGVGVPWVLVTYYGDNNEKYDGGTEKDGSYKISCPPGSYKVVLRPLPVGVGQSPGGNAGDGTLVKSPDGKSLSAIPAHYGDPAKTPLKVNVPDGGKKGEVLKLK
jgi:hypothetical protein